MADKAAALSYHEPAIVTILILASFLLLANAVNYAFDRLLFCGLIGQIAVGVAFGTPGGDILPLNVQDTVMQLGYLGLILLVYEGGLSTDLKTLKSNLFLSSLVALIGIGAPIGLSFALQGFMDITPVQAFAAGAALCSTSLGTTFTILSTSGLSQSRLGVVLSSAAMMDDIVGLVMSGIISSLGQSSDFGPVTVIRPVFVSIAFAVLVPLLCACFIRPLTELGLKTAVKHRASRLHSALVTENAAIVLHVLVLIAFVTGASYAGTSNLFAAYLAGAVISWWDGLCHDVLEGIARTQAPAASRTKNTTSNEAEASKQSIAQRNHFATKSRRSASGDVNSTNDPQSTAQQSHEPVSERSSTTNASDLSLHEEFRGTRIFNKLFSPALQTILKPFFFASIGFSIPITGMFAGSVVWRGIVYTILMLIGKMVCGLCLIRFSSGAVPIKSLVHRIFGRVSSCLPWPISAVRKSNKQNAAVQQAQNTVSDSRANNFDAAENVPASKQRPSIPKPTSLYPAALLGSAMVSRGEIGFLISSVAETDGVFGANSDGQSSELFLVVTWAILLCTLLGPIAVGLMVRRVKRLQELERRQKTGKEDPLGIWGIIPASH